MASVSLEQAAQTLNELVNAALAGEDIVLDSRGNGSVRLVPVTGLTGRPQFGSARGLIKIADDFDAPLDDFREYTELSE